MTLFIMSNYKKELEGIRTRIIDYAKKVVQYPKGSDGYDPVDMINLKSSLNNLENFEHNNGFRGYYYIDKDGNKAHSFDFEQSIGE